MGEEEGREGLVDLASGIAYGRVQSVRHSQWSVMFNTSKTSLSS